MRPVYVPTITSQTDSAPVVLDYRGYNSISVQLTQSGTSTSTIQVTDDDIFAAGYVASSGNWFSAPVAGLVAATGNVIGQFAGPYRALRVHVTAYTDGNIKCIVVQSNTVGA